MVKIANTAVMILAFSLMLFIPSMVLAQNYATKVGNQTIIINVKPSNNTIIVNTDKIASIVEQLQEKQHSDWTGGDVLIGSASIVGLFSVSSFVTTRFSDNTKAISAPLLSSAIFVSGLIMTAHLYIMMSIVTGFFSKQLYDLTMMMTIVGVFFVAFSIARIVRVEHRGKRIDPNVDLETAIAGASKENQ